MVWCNDSSRDTLSYLRHKPVALLESPHNCGQHIAMNEMLDRAAKMKADYVVRVDDDCWFETHDWLRRFIKTSRALASRNINAVIGPVVHGLKNPPQAIAQFHVDRVKVERTHILGGICRMHPARLVRHFRFEERLPMGFGEASQMASLCNQLGVMMLRLPSVRVTHGGSTVSQEAENPMWKLEHDMYQYVPVGL